MNDVVVTSSTLGRMVELAWAVGGEDLGTVPCDGMIVSTPSGSTAYNLSNGGPVLVRGSMRWRSRSSRRTRCMRGRSSCRAGSTLTVGNATADVPVAVLVDGHRVARDQPGGEVASPSCDARSLLATLPETTFFGRYRETFSS